MLRRNGARPGLAAGGRAAGTAAVVANRPQPQSVPSAISRQPVALEIVKNGRPIKPFKVVPLDGEMVLAQVVRHQAGTEKAISVPLIVLDYAETVGIRWYYHRNDRTMTMRRIPLAAIRRGTLRADREVYIPFNFMQEVTWQWWPFAERVISLGPTVPEPAGRQLILLPGFGG